MATRENEFVGDVTAYLATVLRPAYVEVRRVESVLRAILVELALREQRGDEHVGHIRSWLSGQIAATSKSVPDPMDEAGTGRKLLARLDDDSAGEPK
jgi:hypothetical protein